MCCCGLDWVHLLTLLLSGKPQVCKFTLLASVANYMIIMMTVIMVMVVVVVVVITDGDSDDN